MPGVHIVTDSACDLTDQLVKEHDVIVVPLTIRFGDRGARGPRQLSPAEFWERCRGKGDLPETAARPPARSRPPSSRPPTREPTRVLCLTISSKLSGTYASAMTAADTFDGIPVRSSTPARSPWARACSSSPRPRRPRPGPASTSSSPPPRTASAATRIYGVIGGLEHLQRGGRIGGARALLGSLLSIKPVIQVKDGEVAEESKQRTRARALAYLTDKVAGPTRPLERLAVADGACDDFADVLASLEAISPRAPVAARSTSARSSAPTPGPTRSASATSSLPGRPATAE